MSADDAREEYASVVFETIENAAKWTRAPEELPPWFGTDYHVAGEMYQLSSRLVKGFTNEFRGRQYASDRGYDVLKTEEAVSRTGKWADVDDMEYDGVDFMTADGTHWQVKSSKPDTFDADRLLVVSCAQVREY
jgi:hypothetical protein